MSLFNKEPKSNGHGGARPGAGRPKGSVDKVSINSLLEALVANSGESYVELLAQDFVHARSNDKHLAQKYHQLILSKVAPTLNQVENVEPDDAVQAKAQAFAEALASLATVSNKGK
jgi:hypothetical protein